MRFPVPHSGTGKTFSARNLDHAEPQKRAARRNPGKAGDGKDDRRPGILHGEKAPPDESKGLSGGTIIAGRRRAGTGLTADAANGKERRPVRREGAVSPRSGVVHNEPLPPRVITVYSRKFAPI